MQTAPQLKRRRRAEFAALVLVGLAGISMKSAAVHLEPPSAHDRDLKSISAALESRGLVVRARGTITRDASYAGIVLDRPGCDGLLAVVPLYRNAEGKNLMTVAGMASDRTAYAMEGRLLAAFPAGSFWLASLGDTARIAFGIAAVRPWKARILALRERGNCDLMAEAARVTAPNWDGNL